MFNELLVICTVSGCARPSFEWRLTEFPTRFSRLLEEAGVAEDAVEARLMSTDGRDLVGSELPWGTWFQWASCGFVVSTEHGTRVIFDLRKSVLRLMPRESAA